MELIACLRTQARANRLANHRLHGAMAALTEPDYRAPRIGFFPSLAATLEHILAVDMFYLAALHGEADMEAQWRAAPKPPTLAGLTAAQAAIDERFIAHLERLAPAQLDDPVRLDRGDGNVQAEPRGHVIQHLLNHQVHHRGQVHAMLAGSAVKPPQLDEFLMRSDAVFRTSDLRALGWTEGTLFP